MTLTNKPRQLLIVINILFIVALLFSCSDDKPKRKHSRAQSVHVVSVSHSPMLATYTLSGTLEAEPTIEIYNQEEGLIVSLLVYEGDHVEKDQLLARLDATLISAELKKAKIAHRQAALDYKRLKKLRKKRLTTDDALTQAKTTLELTQAEESLLQIRYQYTQIKAPFSGVITQRLKNAGDVIAKYSHLLTLADLSQLKAKVSVSERLLPDIQRNHKVAVVINALGNKSYPASISRIYPEIDKKTRLGIIEVSLDTLPTKARPGQLVQVILENKTTARLHIPVAAIKHKHDGSYVFKIVNNKALQTKVTTGLLLGNDIEITSGLQENDQVVIQGFLGLSHNKPVNIISVQTK